MGISFDHFNFLFRFDKAGFQAYGKGLGFQERGFEFVEI